MAMSGSDDSPPAWCRTLAFTERFLIRTLRIAAALIIVWISFRLFDVAIDILGQPFASLSPLGLLGGIVAGLGGLLLLVIAFGAAFGEKGDSRVEAAWRRSQMASPEIQRKILGYDK